MHVHVYMCVYVNGVRVSVHASTRGMHGPVFIRVCRRVFYFTVVYIHEMNTAKA